MVSHWYPAGNCRAGAQRTIDAPTGSAPSPARQGMPNCERDRTSIQLREEVPRRVSVDQGGCIETCKPTTHENPTYVVDGILHYCVANMPGAVPYTSTVALTNATLPYAIQLANKGWEIACAENQALAKGLNIRAGKILHKGVSEAYNG